MTLSERIAQLNLIELEEKTCQIGNSARPNTPAWKEYETLNVQVQNIYAQLQAEFGLTQDELASQLDEILGE